MTSIRPSVRPLFENAASGESVAAESPILRVGGPQNVRPTFVPAGVGRAVNDESSPMPSAAAVQQALMQRRVRAIPQRQGPVYAGPAQNLQDLPPINENPRVNRFRRANMDANRDANAPSPELLQTPVVTPPRRAQSQPATPQRQVARRLSFDAGSPRTSPQESPRISLPTTGMHGQPVDHDAFSQVGRVYFPQQSTGVYEPLASPSHVDRGRVAPNQRRGTRNVNPFNSPGVFSPSRSQVGIGEGSAGDDILEHVAADQAGLLGAPEVPSHVPDAGSAAAAAAARLIQQAPPAPTRLPNLGNRRGGRSGPIRPANLNWARRNLQPRVTQVRGAADVGGQPRSILRPITGEPTLEHANVHPFNAAAVDPEDVNDFHTAHLVNQRADAHEAIRLRRLAFRGQNVEETTAHRGEFTRKLRHLTTVEDPGAWGNRLHPEFTNLMRHIENEDELGEVEEYVNSVHDGLWQRFRANHPDQVALDQVADRFNQAMAQGDPRSDPLDRVADRFNQAIAQGPPLEAQFPAVPENDADRQLRRRIARLRDPDAPIGPEPGGEPPAPGAPEPPEPGAPGGEDPFDPQRAYLNLMQQQNRLQRYYNYIQGASLLTGVGQTIEQGVLGKEQLDQQKDENEKERRNQLLMAGEQADAQLAAASLGVSGAGRSTWVGGVGDLTPSNRGALGDGQTLTGDMRLPTTRAFRGKRRAPKRKSAYQHGTQRGHTVTFHDTHPSKKKKPSSLR